MANKHIGEFPHKVGFPQAIKEVVPAACAKCACPKVHYFEHSKGVALSLDCDKWDTCEKRKEE